MFANPGYVKAATIHNTVTRIAFINKEIYINQTDFFNYFPNLKLFQADFIGAKMKPFFTGNKNIITIDVKRSTIETEATRVIDHTMIGGLSKLTTFRWEYGNITNLSQNAFNGTYNLQYLYLAGNTINQLQNCRFDGLSNLRTLSLDSNRVSIVEPYAFLGLNELRSLFLNDNGDFPLSTISPLKKLENLYLSEYTKNLTAEIFQQFPRLTFIDLANKVFQCGCEDQWISKLQLFGITTILTSACGNDGSKTVDDPGTYSSCQNMSYQCFNNSIVCPGDSWYRVDGVDGCNCTYPVELSLYDLICSDVDECQNSSICLGTCINTPGSYKCDCNEGFYNVNDTICSDIDECTVVNGNCTHNCTNNIGSYECSCLQGYKKVGFNECFLTDQCKTNNGGCHHKCVQSDDGHVCSCFEGFKVSLNKSHCEPFGDGTINEQVFNVNQPQFLLVLILTLLFFISTVFLLVLLIFVVLYFRRQLQLANSIPAPKVLSLAQFDNIRAENSTVIKNPLTESKKIETDVIEVEKGKQTEEATKTDLEIAV